MNDKTRKHNKLKITFQRSQTPHQFLVIIFLWHSIISKVFPFCLLVFIKMIRCILIPSICRISPVIGSHYSRMLFLHLFQHGHVLMTQYEGHGMHTRKERKKQNEWYKSWHYKIDQGLNARKQCLQWNSCRKRHWLNHWTFSVIIWHFRIGRIDIYIQYINFFDNTDEVDFALCYFIF